MNNEQVRLHLLHQLNILDTPPSESFDRISRLASQVFGLPIAAVSLTDTDRQWFKSRVGVDHREIPRLQACCAEVADTAKVLVVEDLLEDASYKDSFLAKSGIRFYAGAPLLTRDGYALGAMCVLGHEPRKAKDQEQSLLEDLAAMVMGQIELQHAFGRVDPVSGLPNRSQLAEDLDDLARDDPGAAWVALCTELLDVTQASSLQRAMGPEYLDEIARIAAKRLQVHLGPGTPSTRPAPASTST